MPALDPWQRNRSSAAAGTVRSPTDYPTTISEWQDRLLWLNNCYNGNGYSSEAEDAWHLFRAEDPNGKEIARTRRIFTDFKFITDTDAQALTGGGLMLQLPDELSADEAEGRRAALDAGQGCWARSRFDELASVVAHRLAKLGMVGLEVRREKATAPHRSRVVFHAAGTYHCEYDDATGLDLERVTITLKYMDKGVKDDGTIDAGAMLHTYRRVLDKEQITVTLDGEPVPDESGPHGAGVVPFIPLVWQPAEGMALGLNAAHGIESAIAECDSFMTQISAIGNRVGNPIPTVTGAVMGAGSEAGEFGRWMFHSSDKARFGYMEPSLQGVAVLLDAIEKLSDRVRQTFPEYALFGGGANMSGEALKMRGDRFTAKINDVRSRVLPAIARAFGIAVAMDAGREYDPTLDRFEVAAGPILSPDRTAVITDVANLTRANLLKRTDAIRQVQRIGYAPADADPAEYAAEALDEASDRASAFFSTPTNTGA